MSEARPDAPIEPVRFARPLALTLRMRFCCLRSIPSDLIETGLATPTSGAT